MSAELSLEQIRKLRDKIRRDPAWFVSKVLGDDAWEMQTQLIESVRDNVRTAVGACHAPGKTRGAARVVPWFLLAFKDSKVICTAPTWRQVEQLLFAEIRKLLRVSRYELGLRMPPKAPEIYVTDDWYAIGLSTNEAERFQGYHAPAILVIVDEASGVSDEIFEAIEGLLASGAVVRLLLLSNTTKAEGEFYRACTDPKTLYKVFLVSCLDTPNFASIRDAYRAATTPEERLAILRSVPDDRLPRPYLVKPSWVADLCQKYGEDSQVVKIRAFAEFPGEQPDQLFPLHLVEQSMNLWDNLSHKHWWEVLNGQLCLKKGFAGHLDLGADIGRYGDSETGVAPIAAGLCAPLQTWSKTGAPETAARLQTLSERLRARRLRIDDDGVGGPVRDLLVKAGMQNVVPFRGGLPARNKRRYLNARCEAYFDLLELLLRGELALPRDPKLLAQLTCLRYWLNEDGQLCVTTKEMLRKEGKESPDRADMVMMAVSRLTGVTLADKPLGW